MEYLCGKRCAQLDRAGLVALASNHREVLVDLGTGDGRYVQAMAQAYPEKFVIGLDACRENLYSISRKAPANTLYLIANAENLPAELAELATEVTVNFPWGSLLTGLMDQRSGVIPGLQKLMCPGAKLEIRLNASAIEKTGYTPEQTASLIRYNLFEQGFEVKPAQKLDAVALRNFPTTWAKRLAFGRDPQALYLKAIYSSTVLLPEQTELVASALS